MASSSVERPIPMGPQVFICFHGKDVRKNFISFLDHALREANIKVFTDEDELLGSDLTNLLKRIEESEIALVIFSEDFASSFWCLDELAKIKERKDEGRIKVIPIFYKVKPSVVKYLRGQFGDNFRDLKRNNLHQQQRTLKWQNALETIPGTKGMPLDKQSDTTDKDFITKMVIQIQRLLEDMAMKRNQEKEVNHQEGTIVTTKNPGNEAKRPGGSLVPASEPDEEPTLIGEGSVVPSMVCAKDLKITHFDQPQKWVWSTINEGPNSAEIGIVTMRKIHWLKMVGAITTKNLTPGTKYEAVFLVKLENTAKGWEKPVTLKLKVVQHDGDDNRVDRNENLNDYIGKDWVDILAGVFIVPPKNTPATIKFTMYQYETNYKKTGLVLKGVAIRPTNL